eukprot:3823289-Ditylum_brightwellii.AAC.1
MGSLSFGTERLPQGFSILNHANETIVWDDASIPIKSASAQTADSFHIEDPEVINDMVGQIAGD